MSPGVCGPLRVEVVWSGRGSGRFLTSGSRSSAQLPLYRTCTRCWMSCGLALGGSCWPFSRGGSGHRQRGARAMMSSAAARWETP
eukprot:6466048-Amphidinium_carterae.1